ncbi:MAG TPA: hypothetical protein VIO33_05765 [Burkholderiaceae bacterium]
MAETLIRTTSHVASYRWPHALTSSLAAAGASALTLLWRGERDSGGHAAAPLNAVSHWWWPRRALREDRPSWRYTGNGLLVHVASSWWWAAIYAACRRLRREPTAANAVADAAAVGAAAALVDLKLVPERLTPGFERRLSSGSLAWVYVAFAVGLAVGGVIAARR